MSRIVCVTSFCSLHLGLTLRAENRQNNQFNALSILGHRACGEFKSQALRRREAADGKADRPVLLPQGIVGSMPWNAMVFFTLWLQLLGFSDFVASVLMAIFASGCALGQLLGGMLGVL